MKANRCRPRCLATVVRHAAALAVAVALLPGLGPAAVSAADSTEAPVGAAQYQAILKDYQDAEQVYRQALAAARTPEERNQALQKFPRAEQYATKFLRLARQHPKGTAAEDALVWVASRVRDGEVLKEALDLLIADHIRSAKLAPVCQSLGYSGVPGAESVLGAILDQSPHRPVQAQACLSLGLVLKDQAEFAKLDGADASRKQQAAEQMFERVAADYRDVKGWRGTLGEEAESQLFELRNLALGKTAPEIEGADVDGVRFKLSDYRGKVVVLDFWGDW